MSDLQSPASHPASLRGSEGELVFVRIYADARVLEDVLEALAQAAFPVNPEIRHESRNSIIEFPAYAPHVAEVRELIRAAQIAGVRVEVADALAAIQ
jgi:hypothetical protein